MAAKIIISFFALFSFLLIINCLAQVSPDDHCVVCNKYCHKSDKSVRKVNENDVLYECFGLNHDGPGVICSACRRAIHDHKTTGKTFFHVSPIFT